MPASLLGWVGGLALGAVSACGGDEGGADGDGGSGCTPNAQVACACPGGGSGVQVCNPDGLGFGPCMCGDGGGTDDGGSGESTTGEDDGDGDAEGTTAASPCGNGVEDPGECDEEDAAYCPDDCESSDDTSGSGGGGDSTTGEIDNCEDEPIFIAMTPVQPSVWTSGGIQGFGAGNMMCMALGMGADHVCDYEEVLLAEAHGDFAAIPAGTTAWIHRTTPAMVGAAMSPPGAGGRCQDWNYGTNHIADGEFVTFGAGGAATYTLDNDTVFDPGAGSPNPHVQMGLLECGGQMRAILCCAVECVPEG